ncbi:hypothetical protein DBIPINDM_008317 (plasmid) [Mesorhizobium sp. AR02]|uniref:hypothetical protein n=1 Tax=Mesorhizobium sp. AR02 TaxID=2865837 RepID=UPI0021604179|nr:hypothetical protein [Mesorhizobium sp. AR02]UVK57376.1 hypothetical protein DBIPINDM_008317 [Mesorhizobium sp. AR02]
MGFFGKLFSGVIRQKPSEKPRTGDMRKTTGAGPAIAAHSKDANTDAATGQNRAAAAKKSRI